MGSIWRSQPMQKVQLFIQKDSAHDTLDELGELGSLQFKDLNQAVNSFQRTFVTEVKHCEELERKLRFLAEQDSVAFLMQSNVTARIISGLLQFCCKFSQQEASLVNLVWFIENVLSALNMLCSVDPSNGHQAVLQFVEENIEGSNDMFQRAVSSLMIMPVIVTGALGI
ncbi:vacuolar proton ATPase 100-kDa subunit [Pelomyxa schiedti]|nr:vacuolar proton ATPase 100-kDa subunit [Pelomyxa schiedti]